MPAFAVKIKGLTSTPAAPRSACGRIVQGSKNRVKNYEVVYIFDSGVSEEQVQEKLNRYHELLLGPGEGEITATDVWGRRQLAFPIKKKNSGTYVIVQFRTAEDALP